MCNYPLSFKIPLGYKEIKLFHFLSQKSLISQLTKFAGLTMKYLYIFPIILGFLISCSHLTQPNKTKSLDAEWSFRKAGDSLWFPAQIPGNVHGDLLRNGLIRNPFYGTNENKIQWIEKADWQYVGRFFISINELKYQHIELSFDGLDTYAEVFLNQHKVFSAKNNTMT